MKHFPLPTVEEAFVPIHIINGLKGTTIYEIGGYTIYGHAKFDQSEKNFIDFNSGKQIYIKDLDLCETIPIEKVQEYWSINSQKYFEIVKRYCNT